MTLKTYERNGDNTAFKAAEPFRDSSPSIPKERGDHLERVGPNLDSGYVLHRMKKEGSTHRLEHLTPPKTSFLSNTASISTPPKLAKTDLSFSASAKDYYEKCLSLKVPFFFLVQPAFDHNRTYGVIASTEFEGLSDDESAKLPSSLLYLDHFSDDVKHVSPLDENADPTAEIYHSFFLNFASLPNDKTEHSFEYFNRAISSEAFRLGLGVTQSDEVASSLLRQIPQSMRRFAFTDLLTVALSSRNEKMLQQCLEKGASVTAVDGEGGFIIWEACIPGNEHFLKMMLGATIPKEDIEIVRGALHHAGERDWPVARNILQMYLARRDTEET